MGIEQMPPQCLDCPFVMGMKTLSEMSRQDAIEFEHEQPEALETIMIIHDSSDSIGKTYESIAEHRAHLAHLFGCVGVDVRNWECGLDISKEKLQF